MEMLNNLGFENNYIVTAVRCVQYTKAPLKTANWPYNRNTSFFPLPNSISIHLQNCRMGARLAVIIVVYCLLNCDNV